MEALIDLVKIVSSAHSPLPEVVLEDVVGVSELVGVALGLGWLSSVGSVDVSPVVNVLVVEALRGSEAEVIVPGSRGLSEASHGGGNETCRLL